MASQTRLPFGPGTGLTVFFPAYNDESTIEDLVIRASRTAATLTSDFEVLVIDDGSIDGTAARADALARAHDRVRVIRHSCNRGYGAAVRTGFGAATKELVFYTDGDGQYDPAEMIRLWPRMTGCVDLVTGYKIRRADPLSRVVIGRVYHHLANVLFSLRVRDVNCDFRLVRRSTIDRLQLGTHSGSVGLELIAKARDRGLGIAEVPVSHYARSHGQSQFFSPTRIGRTVLDVVALWWTLVVRTARLPLVIRTAFPRKLGRSTTIQGTGGGTTIRPG